MTKLSDGPVSDAHIFKELMSQNPFCECWSGINSTTGRTCFLKVFQFDGNPDNLTPVFVQSAKLQERIKSRLVLTARTAQIEGSTFCVEYPFLDRTVWCSLHEELFWKYFPDSLIQMSLLIDYLHLLGLVHCDLKLSNFLMRADGDRCKIMLADLDFMTLSGSKPEAIIVGSPGHIPPEILNNDIISPLSDNYSIGVALRQSLQWLTGADARSSEALRPDIGNLPALIDALAAADPLDRPRNILDALHDFAIIDHDRFQESLKTLLTMQMATSFLGRRPKVRNTEQWVLKFVTQENKVFGLPEELLQDIGRSYPQAAWNCYQAIRTLIQDARIGRFADYWHLTCSDNSLAKAFAAITSDKTAWLFSTPDNESAAISASSLIERAQTYVKSDFRLKAFLCFKQGLYCVESSPSCLPEPVLKDAFHTAGSLAKGLNRLDDAVRYFRRALEFHNPGSAEFFAILDDLAQLSMRMGQYAAAQEFIDIGLREALHFDDNNRRIEFQIHQSWWHASQGDIAGATDICKALIEPTAAAGLKIQLYRIYGHLGIFAQRRGDRTESASLYRKALETVDAKTNPAGAISILINYSLLCFDSALYEESIRTAKQAIKYARVPDDAPRLPNLYITISSSCTRLCQGKKSLYWLHRYLEGIAGSSDSSSLAHYYSYLGWMEMNLGRFRDARESLLKSIDLFRSDWFLYNRGKSFHNLAELAFLAGDRAAIAYYSSEANAVHDHLHDRASRAETALITGLEGLFYNTDNVQKDVVEQVEELLRADCRYYAALGLFCLLLRAGHQHGRAALEKASELTALCRKSHVPLFKALTILADLQSDTVTASHRVIQLKNAYRLLEGSGQLFLAMMVSDKIGDVYMADGKRRLSLKFWNQALKLAEDLENNLMAGVFREKISQNSHDQTFLETRIESLAKISEIIKNVDKYETTLESIVQFAVEETGAERGALLLQSPDTPELQIKAFVNCDNASLRDIWNLSRNIPSLVAQASAPLIIDNALCDERTKNLKSIVLHNIRSVVCIPIKYNDEVLGALYLDHHSIPSLFDNSDLVFISTLANLIAVVLYNAEQLRTAAADSQRLSHELIQLGSSKRFLTANREMMTMLKPLPAIAHTNASVLLVGESGTGKEIICDMIHDLSLRARKPLIKMNCAAIAGTLIESELFGVAKGAATGVEKREGKFSAADGGTLFLDEIADMPLDIQAKVLRVLENQQFEKVGSNHTIFTDIRFIAATNRDLNALIAEGKFRQDLFFRINTIVIEIPPLRERPEDVPLLLHHYIEVFSLGIPGVRFTDNAVQALTRYPWPGNVRELRNFVERQSILNKGRLVDLADLPAEMRETEATSGGLTTADLKLNQRIIELLTLYHGNQSRVARELGIPLSTLRRRIKKYSLSSSV